MRSPDAHSNCHVTTTNELRGGSEWIPRQLLRDHDDNCTPPLLDDEPYVSSPLSFFVIYIYIYYTIRLHHDDDLTPSPDDELSGVARIEARDLEKLATTKMGPNDTSGVVWTLCEYFSFLLFRNADYYN